jgi:hypothetical protein
MKNHRGIRKIVWTCAVTAAAIVVVPQMAQAGTAAFDKAMQPILEEYLKIQAALADQSCGHCRWQSFRHRRSQKCI